jgi:hypothetical protein
LEDQVKVCACGEEDEEKNAVEEETETAKNAEEAKNAVLSRDCFGIDNRVIHY